VVYNRVYTAPQRIDILAFDGDNLESMSFECFRDTISFEIFRRVSSNCDIIVIDEQFDVESLGDCEPCSFSIVAFLLRAIRAKAENCLVTIGEGNAVDKWPEYGTRVR